MIFEIINPILIPIVVGIQFIIVYGDNDLYKLRNHLNVMRDHRKTAYDAEKVKKVKDALIDKMRS